MIEFEIKSRISPLGDRKGQTVYYAQPRSQQRMTTKILIERIVRETSMSAGDVSNALVSLSNVVCDALTMGMSVDLGELGALRPVVPPKMMNSEEEVTAAKALKSPKIIFTPKAAMRDALKSIQVTIRRAKDDEAGKGTEDHEEEERPGGL